MSDPQAQADAILDQRIVASLGAIPTSLEALFDKDPLSLTQDDLMSVVLHLRATREAVLKEEADSKNNKTKPNYKKAAEKVKINTDGS